MKNRTPAELISSLIEARARRDVAAAVACYEIEATVLVAPDKVMRGTSAAQAFTEAVMNLPLVFSARTFVEGSGVALHHAKWTVVVGEGEAAEERTGRTADLLREQPDGTWLLAVDNAWGTAILDVAEQS